MNFDPIRVLELINKFREDPDSLTDEEREEFEEYSKMGEKVQETFYHCPCCGENVDKDQEQVAIWGLGMTNSTKAMSLDLPPSMAYYFHRDCFIPFMESKYIQYDKFLEEGKIEPLIKPRIPQ